ncbi:MAG: SdrD B-like domain-containing protein, partial [Gemmataceae bacterium]
MGLNPTDLLRRHARKLLRNPQPAPKVAPAKLKITHLEDRVVPAITGTVFQDYNGNGSFETTGILNNEGSGTIATATDTGLAGVTVTAFDANNNNLGSVQTSTNGTYTLNVPATGQYRVEFTNLPSGYKYGPSGISAGTAVQFVDSGVASNINLAAVEPIRSNSSNNPLIFTNQYSYGGTTPGAATSPNADAPAIISFRYSAGAVDTDTNADNHKAGVNEIVIPQSQVGTTWGLGYDQVTNRVFASSYTKRHAGYGPAGPGAIYSFAVPEENSTVKSTSATPWFVLPAGQAGGGAGSLNALRLTYTNIDEYNRDGDNLGWDSVGKTSWGGLDVNETGSELYAMNLFDRNLYVIPINNDGTAGTPRTFQVPKPSNATGNGLGDVRPFAVQYYKGLVYVGMVNSAETTQNSADLRAYVYTFNPATNAWSSSSVVNGPSNLQGVSLDYDKLSSYAGPDRFVPWSSTFRNSNPAYQISDNGVKYAQPMLTGITFDNDGNMILGMRTRSSDQVGVQSFSDPNNPTYPVEGIASGDLLKAFINTQNTPQSGWVIEQNGGSVVVNNAGTGTGANNQQGPAGGEFFGEDGYGGVAPDGSDDLGHRDVGVGGVLQIPGFPEVMTTTFDPQRTGPLKTGGIRWFDSATGDLDKSYILYQSQILEAGQIPNTFGKAAGVGDLVAVPQKPPIEIGNRIWADSNSNGRQDPGEATVSDVTVELWNAGADGTVG